MVSTFTENKRLVALLLLHISHQGYWCWLASLINRNRSKQKATEGREHISVSRIVILKAGLWTHHCQSLVLVAVSCCFTLFVELSIYILYAVKLWTTISYENDCFYITWPSFIYISLIQLFRCSKRSECLFISPCEGDFRIFGSIITWTTNKIFFLPLCPVCVVCVYLVRCSVGSYNIRLVLETVLSISSLVRKSGES